MAGRIARATPFDPGVPVICIGNIVAGGAGKTPVALAVMERLQRSGLRGGLLSRGYCSSIKDPSRVDAGLHSSRQVGDEPLLLARRAPTWIGRDRVATARLAVQAGVNVLVMDDGLQNPSLVKRLSILVIDGQYGFGNGRVMPAGPLREPVAEALKRVEVIVVLGACSSGLRKDLPDHIPILTARFQPAPEDDEISGKPVVAFAGIGRPEKFFETLAGMGCDLIDVHPFPDHHYYSTDEIMHLIDSAAAAGAIVVTTEKDMVRVPEEARNMVRSLRVELDWEDTDALEEILSQITSTMA